MIGCPMIKPMSERKIGGVPVYQIANTIVHMLVEIHKQLHRPGTSQDKLRKYLFRYENSKDGCYIDANEFKGLINTGAKAERGKKEFVRTRFKNALMEEFNDIIESYVLGFEIIDEKTIHCYSLELPDKNEYISSEERRLIQNNTILWCKLINELEKKHFNGNKLIERFKNHKSFCAELENLLEEMYPPEDKRFDYSYVDDLKKDYKILVKTDDDGALKRIKKYAKKGLHNENIINTVTVTDDADDEEYDIIYVIDDQGSFSLKEIQEITQAYKHDCIKRIFCNSKIISSLGTKNKLSFIEYSDNAVYLLYIIEDVMSLVEKDSSISRRFAQRIEKLRNLSQLNDKGEIGARINSAKARADWEKLLAYSDELMDTSKEIYQEYIKEQKILIENNLFPEESPEKEMLVNALKANVDKRYFGDLAALYQNSDKGYDAVIEASREKIKTVYYLCYGIGDHLIENKEYNLAFDFLQIACGISELMKEDYLVFESTLNLIQANWRLKNYDKVNLLIEAIEDKLIDNYSRDKKKYYMLYRNLKHYKASYLHAQRKLDAAIEEFTKAKDAIKKQFVEIENKDIKLDDDSISAANKLSGTYNNMSIVYRRSLKIWEAEQCSDRCIALNEKLNDHRKNAVAYRNRAVMYYSNFDLSFDEKRSKCENWFEKSRKENRKFVENSLKNDPQNKTILQKEEFGYELAYAEYCVRMGCWIIEDKSLKKEKSYLEWLDNAEEHLSNANEVFEKIKTKEQLPSEKSHLERIKAKINLSYYIGNPKEQKKGEEACKVYLDILEDMKKEEKNNKAIFRPDRKFYVLYDLTMYYKKKEDGEKYRRFGTEMLEARKELIRINKVYEKYPEVRAALSLTKDLRK